MRTSGSQPLNKIHLVKGEVEIWDLKSSKTRWRSQPLIERRATGPLIQVESSNILSEYGTIDSEDRCPEIFHSRIFPCKGNQGLRFNNSKVQNSKSTIVVDQGGGGLNHWSQEIDLGHPFESTIKIVRLKVISHCVDRNFSIFTILRAGLNRDHSFR